MKQGSAKELFSRERRWTTLIVQPTTSDRDVDATFDRAMQWQYDGIIIDLTADRSANRELVVRSAIAGLVLRDFKLPLTFRVAASEAREFMELDATAEAFWNIVLHLPMEAPIAPMLIDALKLNDRIAFTLRFLRDSTWRELASVADTLGAKGFGRFHAEFPFTSSRVGGGWRETKVADWVARMKMLTGHIDIAPPIGSALESSDVYSDEERFPDPQIVYSKTYVGSSPKLSVIVTSYERMAETLNCVRQLMRQRLDKNEFEMILVDRGSHDSTVRDLEKLIESEARTHETRIVRFEKPIRRRPSDANYRKSLARNLGASLARAQTLVFLDEENIVSRDFLANVSVPESSVAWVAREHDLNEGAFGVRLSHERVQIPGEISIRDRGMQRDFMKQADRWSELQHPWRFFKAGAFAIDATAFKNAGWFREGMFTGGFQDEDFAIRWSATGGKFVLSEETVYRQHRPFVNRPNLKMTSRAARVFHRFTLDESVFDEYSSWMRDPVQFWVALGLAKDLGPLWRVRTRNFLGPNS